MQQPHPLLLTIIYFVNSSTFSFHSSIFYQVFHNIFSYFYNLHNPCIDLLCKLCIHHTIYKQQWLTYRYREIKIWLYSTVNDPHGDIHMRSFQIFKLVLTKDQIHNMASADVSSCTNELESRQSTSSSSRKKVSIQVGDSFDSYKSLMNVQEYKRSNYVQSWKRDARKIEAARKRLTGISGA